MADVLDRQIQSQTHQCQKDHLKRCQLSFSLRQKWHNMAQQNLKNGICWKSSVIFYLAMIILQKLRCHFVLVEFLLQMPVYLEQMVKFSVCRFAVHTFTVSAFWLSGFCAVSSASCATSSMLSSCAFSSGLSLST